MENLAGDGGLLFEEDSCLGNLTLWKDRCIVEVVQVACSMRCLAPGVPGWDDFGSALLHV